MENTNLSPNQLESQMIKEYKHGQPYAIVMLIAVVATCFLISLAVITFVVAACNAVYNLVTSLI